MQIIHLSETLIQHRQLDKLPATDVIFHFGNFIFLGCGEEGSDFIFIFTRRNKLRCKKILLHLQRIIAIATTFLNVIGAENKLNILN
jgi:hypothetical protein